MRRGQERFREKLKELNDVGASFAEQAAEMRHFVKRSVLATGQPISPVITLPAPQSGDPSLCVIGDPGIIIQVALIEMLVPGIFSGATTDISAVQLGVDLLTVLFVPRNCCRKGVFSTIDESRGSSSTTLEPKIIRWPFHQRTVSCVAYWLFVQNREHHGKSLQLPKNCLSTESLALELSSALSTRMANFNRKKYAHKVPSQIAKLWSIIDQRINKYDFIPFFDVHRK